MLVLSSSGVKAGEYQTLVTVDLTLASSVSRSIEVRLIVSAPPVAEMCTRNEHCHPEREPPPPLTAVLYELKYFRFTACDADGLPTTTPAIFGAVLAACGDSE
eukprot:4073156-Prymnesium_polylepis.1